MKTLLSLLTILSLMFISCSASSVESDEDNKIADRPITPKEMQRMMGRGFDVNGLNLARKLNSTEKTKSKLSSRHFCMQIFWYEYSDAKMANIT